MTQQNIPATKTASGYERLLTAKMRPIFFASAHRGWPSLECGATGPPMQKSADPFATARALWSSG